MKFKQYKNGSCDIIFNQDEINIIKKNNKIHLSDESLKHFGNTLVKIVVEWNEVFNKKIKNLQTNETVSITGTKVKND